MNIGQMMKKAQQMKQQMQQEQAKIAEETFVGKSPEDLVTVTFSGDKQMKDMKVRPEAIDPDDPDTLSDLVVSAVNDALGNVDKTLEEKMSKYTKGMNIPGM